MHRASVHWDLSSTWSWELSSNCNVTQKWSSKKKRSEYKHKLSECAVALAVVVTTSQTFTVQICIWYFSQTASFLLRYSLVVTLPATEWFGYVKCKLQFEIRQNPYTQQNADCVASFRHIIDHINRADRYNFFYPAIEYAMRFNGIPVESNRLVKNRKSVYYFWNWSI